jgi:hypothetical protein
MYVNYPPSQFESLSLTTDPHPEELEIEKEVIELPPLNRTSLPSSNGDGGIYLVQRGNSLASQKSEELQKTLLAHRHERQLVILQDFPDPDALSCAWSYQLIAQQYDIQPSTASSNTARCTQARSQPLVLPPATPLVSQVRLDGSVTGSRHQESLPTQLVAIHPSPTAIAGR